MTHEPFAQRQIRAAEDESVCRDENERLGESPGSDLTEYTEYACECTRDCDAHVSLTIDEYEEVRGMSTHFIVAPGHLLVGVEVVVRESPRFQVVEKFGAAAPVANALDPRALDGLTTHLRDG